MQPFEIEVFTKYDTVLDLIILEYELEWGKRDCTILIITPTYVRQRKKKTDKLWLMSKGHSTEKLGDEGNKGSD